MPDARRVIGDFFEDQVKLLFDLIKTDENQSGLVPDLTARDDSFKIEVKASAYNNGGVIRENQLYGFYEKYNGVVLYAFAYHSISKNLENDYPTEIELRNALELRSLFLFPISIVKAHFENTPKRKTTHKSDFVQIRESLAYKLFETNKSTWKHLQLNPDSYMFVKPHKKIHILTDSNPLENKLLNSFNSLYI